MNYHTKVVSILLCSFSLYACGGGGDGADFSSQNLSKDLAEAINSAANGAGLAAYTMPDETDLDNIPQDSNNPITAEKVALGKMLYHETALSTAGKNPSKAGTWSCASCHHISAGFKSGIAQGIGEGGEGFGSAGQDRILATGFDADTTDETLKPDVQDLTSPAVLNVAYQDVMLWNGSFGKTANSVNNAVETVDTAGPPPILANTFGLSGVETQVLAGTNVHRISFDADSIMQTNATYKTLYKAAFPTAGDEGTIPENGTTVTIEALGAAKAIAAYERTILANQSPFQRWLKGNKRAMSQQELRGALLFFGDAGCSGCHKGPGLSSDLNATADEIFFAIGFADFDVNNPNISGSVSENAAKGRGGFTGDSADDFKFKIPQLYNLADSDIFGHGSSFNSVRSVIEYKNAAVPQKVTTMDNLDSRFVPLGLNSSEIDDLTTFIENGLYDPNLDRYVPTAVPSGQCFPVADDVSIVDLGC